jgi:hypothetical protein
MSYRNSNLRAYGLAQLLGLVYVKGGLQLVFLRKVLLLVVLRAFAELLL